MIMYLHLSLRWIIKHVNQENMESVGEQRINGIFSVTTVVTTRTAQKHFNTLNVVRLTRHRRTETHKDCAKIFIPP